MRFAIRYICIFASLLICCSCDLEELKLNNPSESTIDFIARPADYSNVDVTTKSEPTDEFETEIHTAYLLLFDANNNRIYFSEVDPQSRLQRVTLKGLSTVTACFVANVAKADIKGITTLDALNSAVLNLNYATYSEAGGHLGVPKLAVNGTYELCFPMVGVKTLDVSQISQAIEIPLTRLFAKVSVELKMNISNLSTTQSSTRFELISYRLANIPKRVSLLPTGKESDWVKVSEAFADNNSNVASNLTNNQIYNNSYLLASDSQKKYTFDVYVPEYCLSPLTETEYKGASGTYGEQEYKPKMYDSNKKAVHIVLTGSYIPTSGSSTKLDYSLFLGEDESLSFTLNRNVHYNNYLTIKGITKNADNKDTALIDHRVKMSDGNMVSMFGEVANCYVINATGTYSFPAYKGAYKAADMVEANRCTIGTKVEIIAQNGVTTLFATDDNGKPKFTLTTNPAGEKVISFEVVDDWGDANVILGLKDNNGNVEWSWHLWFVKGVSLGNLNLGGFFEMGYQDMPNGKDKLMDRNLGALFSLTGDGNAGAATGFYYRYGQIAPYFTDVKDKGTTYHGHTLPNNSSWTPTDNKKSPSDPCPPGYRVPASGVWDRTQGFEDVSLKFGDYGLEAFRYWNNNTSGVLEITDDIYFPYSAYIKNAAGELYVGPQNQIGGTNYTETTTINTYVAGKYNLRIEYQEVYSIKNGVFWASNGAIDYSMCFNEIGDEKKLQYKKEKDAWSKATTVDLESVKDIWLIGKYLNDAANELIKNLAIENEGDLKKVELAKATDYYAAQVRCVKE